MLLHIISTYKIHVSMSCHVMSCHVILRVCALRTKYKKVKCLAPGALSLPGINCHMPCDPQINPFLDFIHFNKNLKTLSLRSYKYFIFLLSCEQRFLESIRMGKASIYSFSRPFFPQGMKSAIKIYLVYIKLC